MAGPCKFFRVEGAWLVPEGKPPAGAEPCARKAPHEGPHHTLRGLVKAGKARKRYLNGADVNSLVRATLHAPPGHTLGVIDFSSVEARGNAWAAGDEEALKVFRSPGGDPYATCAAAVFNKPASECGKGTTERDFGKILELACGYGQGHKKMHDTVIKGGIDWADLPFTAKDAVDGWRELHAPIVKFWRDMQKAAIRAVQGDTVDVGPFTWGPSPLDDGHTWMMLPSGRPIVYFDLRCKRGRRGPELVYWGKRNRSERVYGGLLVENAIQALCRELLVRALARAKAEGYRCVLHVHDEGVWELREETAKADLHVLEEIMCDVPSWAKGFPVGAEGFLSKWYRK